MIRHRIFGGSRSATPQHTSHRLLFAAVLAGFAATACSASSSDAAPIDGAKLEGNIAADAALAGGQSLDGAQAAAQLTADVASAGPALADAKVTCPAQVLTPGGHATFDCTLAIGGASAPITVTLTPGQPLDWAFKV
jgi:hypothetical protein